MRIKRVLLAALTALTLGLASLGGQLVPTMWAAGSSPHDKAPDVAGGKGGMSGEFRVGLGAPETLIAGGKGGISGEFRVGLGAPETLIAGGLSGGEC